MTSILLISDTHCTYPDLPEADLFIHAGDWTYMGDRARNRSEIGENQYWLSQNSHKFKKMIGIAGNHDFGFHKDTFEDCQLLFNEEIEFEGLRVWGSPMTPTFGGWAFMTSEANLAVDYWSQIPEGLDMLITHGPPRGILDTNKRGDFCGSTALIDRLNGMEKPPKHVIFGHIHRDYQMPHNQVTRILNNSGYPTNFYNVSYLNESYVEGYNGMTRIVI